MILVALLSVVVAVEAAADLRHTVFLEEAIGEKGQPRVVDHREHLAVLHEVLGGREVSGRLVVDDLEVDLAAVHPAGGVLGVDPGLARFVRVAERRAGDAGL